jgi:hypothetical protein
MGAYPGCQAAAGQTTASSRAAVLCLTLGGADLVVALTRTVLVDESIEPGTVEGHKGSAGPGPVNRVGLRK